ncbi:MAG: M20/M25/M40 family metallo-hydrolase, partial [Chloroflexota bacterium]
QRLESFGTRNAFSTIEESDFGIGAARRWIQSEFERVGGESSGRLTVSNEPFLLEYLDLAAEQENIVATLAGTQGNNDVIVVMAHYDSRPNSVIDGQSISPGANDNGSGVALLLETARVLSARQWNQTIVFAALSAEEQGTYGSKNLVQQLDDSGLNVIAAINYDTVGGRTDIPRSVRLFAPNIEESISGELARYYAYIGNLYVPTFPVNMVNALDREGRWGDQREFIFAGLPAVRLTESIEESELVNSVNDTWNTIDYSYLSSVTRLNVSVIANMAGSPPKPAPPTIVPTAVAGSYLLTWPRDSQAAGYAISFRPIESLTYPAFRFVNTNQAGQVVLTGYDPNQIYMVSMATLDQNGRISLFSQEVRIEPNPTG